MGVLETRQNHFAIELDNGCFGANLAYDASVLTDENNFSIPDCQCFGPAAGSINRINGAAAQNRIGEF